MPGLSEEDIEKFLKEHDLAGSDDDDGWDVEEYSDDEDDEGSGTAARPAETKPYETPVLLAYVDEEVDNNEDDDESGPTVADNLLGGRPVWLTSARGPRVVAPPRALRACGSCARPMPLLVQLSAAPEGAFYDRVLYVFVCAEPGCRGRNGAARCVRGVRRDTAAAEAAAQAAARQEDEAAREAAAAAAERVRAEKEKERVKGEDLFGGGAGVQGANPFATANPFGGAGSNPFGGGSGNPFAAPALAKVEESKPAVAKKEESKAAAGPKKPTWAQIAAPPVPQPKEDAKTETTISEPAVETGDDAEQDAEEDAADVPAFPAAYYLYVENEVIDPRASDKANKSVTASLSPADLRNLLISDDTEFADPKTKSKGKGKSKGSGNPTALEAATNETLKSQDPAFQKFVDVVGQNAQQVVRYYRSGASAATASTNDDAAAPLLYSSRDAVARILLPPAGAAVPASGFVPPIPAHPVTGEPRAVEMQVMPHAISVLEESLGAKQILERGMEWGTIFVATPLADPAAAELGPDGVGYFEEWVGVQWEK